MSESKQTIDGELDERAQAEKSPGDEPGDAGATSAGGGTSAFDDEAPVTDAGEAAAELQVEADLDKLGVLAAKRDEYLALAQRTQADFENYRKRVARDSALAQERGVAKLAKELLPAIDNLDRAVQAAEVQRPAGGRPSPSDGEPGRLAEDSSLLDGVRLVRSELSAALARCGVESFSPGGEPFDPSLHEAMASVPQPENGPSSGTVVEVYQPGYRLGETIIRPARVVVAA
jgi:molecular chaperone GrpE